MATYLPSDNPKVPKAQFPFRHSLPVQMRFTDIDMLGHLNNNVYMTFMDLAKIEYMQKIDPESTISNIKVVIVHLECDFYAPSYFGEALEVWTTITHVGHRSFSLEQRIVNSTTGQTKCIGHTVMSGFDPQTAKSAPLDAEWVAAAERYEERPLMTPVTGSVPI